MKKCLWMAMLTLLVSGCGELSYKRGASMQDLEATKKSCQSAGSEKAAEQCLQDQGWTVKKLDDVDLFATAGVSPDNRNPSVFITPEIVPVTPAQPATVVTATATATPAADKPALASKTPVASAGTVVTRASTTAPPAAASLPPTAPLAPASPPANPLDLYAISSWWKIGADREALAADTKECVAQLGEAHKPNSKTQQVTRGFVVCMHDKGWKALRAVAG
jgi:hypothetical protein